MHYNSILLFKEYAQKYFQSGLKVLEIGPDKTPSTYQGIVNNEDIVWHTLDLGSHFADITHTALSEYEFPIQDSEYDIVFSAQVIEHVRKPWLWLKELKRVVKRNGLIVIISPISFPYHRQPVDCWRIYPDGMRALCEEHELEMVFCEFMSLELNTHPVLKKNTHLPVVPGRPMVHTGFFEKRIVASRIKWNNLVCKMPFFWRFTVPIEVSYDLITICRKP